MSGHIKSYGQHYLDNNDFLEIRKVLKSDFITQGPYIKKFENSPYPLFSIMEFNLHGSCSRRCAF